MSIPVRSVLSVLTVFIIVSASVTVLSGQAATVGALAAWVKTPAPGDTSAMAFATINNPTMYDVYFTSGATDAAGKVELRDKSKGADPKAQIVEFVTVPAYGSLSMDQNSVYLMLLDLKRPLKQGDTISLTLSTQDGVKIQVSAAVRNQ
jgi:hypothetical protein